MDIPILLHFKVHPRFVPTQPKEEMDGYGKKPNLKARGMLVQKRQNATSKAYIKHWGSDM